jgi:iron donor protein CyaY
LLFQLGRPPLTGGLFFFSNRKKMPLLKPSGHGLLRIPYTSLMIDEATFRRESDRALESLKQSLIKAEESDGTFEYEDNNGVMNIIFEDGSSKFVITPNTPIRQIWISAQATSYKLDWSDSAQTFTLPKTGEELKPLIQRLLREQLNDPTIALP